MSDEAGDADGDDAEPQMAFPRLKPRLVDHDPIQVVTATVFAEHPKHVDQ